MLFDQLRGANHESSSHPSHFPGCESNKNPQGFTCGFFVLTDKLLPSAALIAALRLWRAIEIVIRCPRQVIGIGGAESWVIQAIA